MLDGKMQHLEGKLTPAERTLWVYIQANLETLAFENGASLAAKSGVSPIRSAASCDGSATKD